MIAKKVVTFSRTTGEKIGERIVEEVPMSRDEYWKAVAMTTFHTKSYQDFLKSFAENPEIYK